MYKQAVVRFLSSAMLALSIAGCVSESVDSLVASGDAAMAKGDYRVAEIKFKSALQADPTNLRARWLLGEVYLITEQAVEAEKEIRHALEGGVAKNAALPALAQALLLQKKADEVLELDQPSNITLLAQGELVAARGLAYLFKGEKQQADDLTRKALELAPDTKFTLMARARVLAYLDKLDEAERLLVKLQENHPDYGVAWSLMGDVQDVRGDLPKAEQAYTIAIKKSARSYGDLLKRADVRLRQQNIEGALTDAMKLVDVLPNLQRAWYVVGAAQFMKKDFEKAQEHLGRAYELDGNHLHTAVLLGWTDLNLGNLNQAVGRGERAMAVAPNLIASRLLMATIQLRLQQPHKAEEMIRPVVVARPDNLPAKSILIASLQAQDRGAEAVPLLEEVAAANPESLNLQTAVALELVQARQPEKAQPMLARVAEQAPADARVNHARVSGLIKSKKLDEALEVASRFHEQNPRNSLGLQTLGVVQAERGDLVAAIGTFEEALEIAPDNPIVLLMLGELLRMQGDFAAASKVFQQGVEMHPENASLAMSLAAFKVQQGSRTEAVELLRKALQQNPSHRVVQILLGEQLLAQNDAAGALAVLPEDGGGNAPMLLAVRGEARLQLGDAAAARDDLEQLTLLQPESADAHFKLSQAYAALGDTDGMEKALQAATRLAPNNTAIALSLARLMVAQGRIEQAQNLTIGLGLPESDPGLLATELLIAEARGDQAGHLRLAQRLQAVAPSAENLLLLVQAQYAGGQVAEAEDSMNNWMEQHPGAYSVAIRLAALYQRTARMEEAVAILRPLADRKPENAAVLNDLAWYLRDTAPGESLALAERAAALAPDNVAILHTYATALTFNGRYEKALRVVDAAMRKSAQSGYLRLMRIEILEKSGNLGAARRELEALEPADVPAALQDWVAALRQRDGAPP